MVDLGFRHPFLMRGILAISAWHLARLHPESSQQWLVVAASHQEPALPAHRFIINDVGRNMDNDNFHAVTSYASICLAESIACGGKREVGDGRYSLEEVTEWMVWPSPRYESLILEQLARPLFILAPNKGALRSTEKKIC